MRIHILGICGTFMGSIAQLAQQSGFEVTGSDDNVYPPMSDLLRSQGIEIWDGYAIEHLDPMPDCIVIGNAMKRGNPLVEHILNENLPFYSGPEWLAKYILRDRWVMAVAGTHGKTTTSSMLAWIIEHAGHDVGFLIGGVPKNFGQSARLGQAPFFVVEADEYDTAFFDKRSKFIHYKPHTLVLNNLEFDHADIFPDIDAIKTQFHHLIRTIAQQGLIITNDDDANLTETLERGCWTPIETFSLEHGQWRASNISDDASSFCVYRDNKIVGEVNWGLTGMHNISNALAAIAAAQHAGIVPLLSISALSRFEGVKRRMEVRGVVKGVTVYDDFAHHPTAIKTTLEGLRKKVANQRIIAVLEFASNTMRDGFHGSDDIIDALALADQVLLLKPASGYDLSGMLSKFSNSVELLPSVNDIITRIVSEAKNNDHVLIMSNKSFDGLHSKLLEALS